MYKLLQNLILTKRTPKIIIDIKNNSYIQGRKLSGYSQSASLLTHKNTFQVEDNFKYYFLNNHTKNHLYKGDQL